MRYSRTAAGGLAVLLSAVALSGASAGFIDNLNIFKKKEVPLAGERRAVIVEETTETASGHPLVGAMQSIDWSQPGGNAANAPGHATFGGGGAVAWRAAIGGAGRLGVRTMSPPVIDGGRVFTYDATGVVSAFSTRGGRLWSVAVAKEKSQVPGGGIASGGDRVYVASGWGEVIAFDAASGKRVWSYPLSEPARSAPTVSGGRLYLVTAKNVLHAINTSDGTQAWTYDGIPEREGVLGQASPAVSGGMVVVPYSSGEVIAFDAETGTPKWNDAVVRATRTFALSAMKEVAASPIVYDGMVYATGVAGRTIGVGLSSGERMWEAGFGSSSTPAVSGNALFAVDLRNGMVAVDRKTGKTFWRTQLPKRDKKKFLTVWSGPTLAGGLLYAVSNYGTMVAIDPATGEIKRQSGLAGPALQKPIAAEGRLYVLTRDGALTAFQ